MKLYVQAGEIVPFHNGTGATIASGTVVKTGTGRVGMIQGDILTLQDGEMLIEGVVTVGTDTGTAWVDGDRVFWDDTGKTFTKTALANTPAGQAVGAKLSGAATATVKLMQSSVGQAAVMGAVTAAAAATAGGATPTAGQVDTGIATAIAPLTTGINAILTALKAAGIMANA